MKRGLRVPGRLGGADCRVLVTRLYGSGLGIPGPFERPRRPDDALRRAGVVAAGGEGEKNLIDIDGRRFGRHGMGLARSVHLA